jgi:hypothetical protein
MLTTMAASALLHPVIACSCIPQDSATHALNESALVFSGKVIDIKYLDKHDDEHIEPAIVVTFNVYKYWKGLPGTKVKIHTVYNKFSCDGYNFEEGEEYLVYAFKQESKKNFWEWLLNKPAYKYDVGLCGGTKPLSSADRDLRQLGKPASQLRGHH